MVTSSQIIGAGKKAGEEAKKKLEKTIQNNLPKSTMDTPTESASTYIKKPSSSRSRSYTIDPNSVQPVTTPSQDVNAMPKKDIMEPIGRVLSTPNQIFKEYVRSRNQQLANRGYVEQFNNKQFNQLKPYEQRGTAQITSQRALTDEELRDLPFNAGGDELIRREQNQVNYEIQSYVEEVANSKRPHYENLISSNDYDLEVAVNSGYITVDEARKRQKNFNDAIRKQFEDEVNQEAKPFIDNINQRSIESMNRQSKRNVYRDAVYESAPSLLTGFGLGVAGASSKVASTLIGGYGAVAIGKEAPSLLTETVRGNIQPLSLFAIESAPFLAGGVAGAKVTARRLQAEKVLQAQEAFSNAVIESRSVGYNSNLILKRLALDEQGKAILENAKNQGLSVSLIESKYKARSSKDQRIIDEYDPRAYTIQITGRDGAIIKSYGVGEIQLKDAKGKVISEPLRQMMVGELKDKTFTAYNETIKGKLKSSRFVPESKASYYIVSEETLRVASSESKSKATKSEATISLLDTPSGEAIDFLGTRDSLLRLQNINEGVSSSGKPIKKGELSLLDRELKSEGQGFSLLDTKETFYGKTTGGITSGLSLFEDIPSKSSSKSMKGFEKEITKNEEKFNREKEEFSLLDDFNNSEFKRIDELPKSVGGGGQSASLFEGRGLLKSELLGEDFIWDFGDTKPRPQTIKEVTRGKSTTKQKSWIFEEGSSLMDDTFSLLRDSDRLKSNREISLLGDISSFSFKDNQRDKTNFKESQKEDQSLRFDINQGLNLDLDLGFDISQPDVTPPDVTPSFSLWGMPEQRREKKQTAMALDDAYDVWGYKDSTKGNKARWIKLNKKKLTKDSALDLGAYAVDESISARFKITKTQGKPSSLDDTWLGNFWESNQGKFRNYKVRKGAKHKMSNEFIELSSNRLDTLNELNEISLAKLMKGSGSLWGRVRKVKRRGNSYNLLRDKLSIF